MADAFASMDNAQDECYEYLLARTGLPDTVATWIIFAEVWATAYGWGLSNGQVPERFGG
jgi:hypothetical protein